MRNNHCKKALVIGIIGLFIGAGIYPALARTPDTELIKDSQEVRKSNHAIPGFILEYLYDLIDKIMSRFSHIPEIANICNEILYLLNNDIIRTICIALTVFLNELWFVLFCMLEEPGKPFVKLALIPIMLSILIIGKTIVMICEILLSPTRQTNFNPLQGDIVKCPCIQR